MPATAIGRGRPGPERGRTTDGDVRAGELTRQALRRLVLAALAARALTTLPSLFLTYRQATASTGGLLLLGVVFVSLDLLLLLGTWLRPSLLSSRWIFVGDVAVTLAVNLWATGSVEPGTYLEPGKDPFSGYAWGTIGLWTIARGPWSGALVLGVVYVGQLVSGVANGALPAATFPTNLPVRMMLAAMVFATAAGVVSVVRREAHATAVRSARAGRLAERSEAVRAVHDSALAELEGIVRLVTPAAPARSPDLHLVHETAARRARILRAAPAGDLGRTDDRLALGHWLATEADGFRHRGLTVTYDGPDLNRFGPDDPVTSAVTGAVREALNNVVKHAGVTTASVRARIDDGWLRVTVRDRGSGTARPHRSGTGIPLSVAARMTAVGGRATVHSSARDGTTVSLRVPLASPTGTGRDADLPRTAGRLATVIVTWRMMLLPTIALVESHYIAPVDPLGYLLVLGVLAALAGVNGLQLARAVRGENVLPGTAWVVADLAGAAVLHVVVAVRLAPGLAVAVGPDITWAYLCATIGVWATTRTVAVGTGVLAGAIGLMAVGGVLGGAPVDRTLLLALVNYTGFGIAFLVGHGFLARMAASAERAAGAEARRAGREAERLSELALIQARLLATTEAIRDLSSGPPDAQRAEAVRRLAIERSEDLRELLDRDPPPADPAGLPAALRPVLAAVHARGRRVDLQDGELTGTHPAAVVATTARAVDAVLGHLCDTTLTGRIVIWAAGDRSRLEVRIRHLTAETIEGVFDEILPELSAAGVRATLWSAPGRGVRAELVWGNV